jgi:tripartite-type tricarboxylate transporter receptor subunit TctC
MPGRTPTNLGRMRFALALLGLLAGTVVAAPPTDYPNHPIRLIVPFAPGGGNDSVARVIAQRISTILGQQVVVENRAGAGGIVGAESAAKSPPDGYTLFLGGVGSQVINPLVHKTLPYDPVRDFTPVTLIASAPMLVVVNPALPVKDLRELVAYLKAHPGSVNYATNGPGSSSHLATVMFEGATGTQMTHVAYRGLSAALVDLLSNHVQLMFSSVVAILPQVQAGKLRALAVTGSTRLPSLPDVPTIAEAAVPGYQAGSWYGVLAPAGTPPNVVNLLNSAINEALHSTEVRRALEMEGAVPIGGAPRDFQAHIQAEIARLGPVVRAAKLAE